MHKITVFCNNYSIKFNYQSKQQTENNKKAQKTSLLRQITRRKHKKYKNRTRHHQIITVA